MNIENLDLINKWIQDLAWAEAQGICHPRMRELGVLRRLFQSLKESQEKLRVAREGLEYLKEMDPKGLTYLDAKAFAHSIVVRLETLSKIQEGK